MRNRSLELQRAMRAYRRLLNDFIEEHDTCEFPLGCTQPTVVVHHRRGRFGKRLLDQNWWAGSCHEHNQFAEDQTGAALACGWLVPIEGAQR